MKSKYVTMRPGKGPSVPFAKISTSDNEIDYVVRINSSRFEEGFKYVVNWEMLAWKKPIFTGEGSEG